VLDRERKRKRKSEGGKDGLSDQSDECWERRENISIRRRGYFDCLSFFHFRGFSGLILGLMGVAVILTAIFGY